MRAAIEVRAIGQRTRSGNVTLRDISLAVGHGELVAIIGGSGSGKTALLDAMSGLRPPATGTVLRETAGHIGYVPGAEAIHPVLPLARALHYTTALRATRASGGPAGVAATGNHGAGAGAAAVEEALRLVGLAGQAAAPVGTLDAGQRKRAAIAAELPHSPSLLFLEEPTTGLDPAQGTEVMRLLRSLCDTGSTVVLSTRNPLDAARCDRVAVLAAGGHLAFFGSPAGALDYFAADSLDEIYERLAGLGDPVAAWSRRFSPSSRMFVGVPPADAIPAQPGGTHLVPDSAGPHSAGPVSGDRPGDPVTWAVPGTREQATAAGRPASAGSQAPPAGPAERLHASFRGLGILLTRNAEVLARSRRASAVAAGVPVAMFLAFLVLLGTGALDGATAVSLAWAVLAGFGVGAAYGLIAVHGESGVLRRERSAGLSVAVFVLAKAMITFPALAVADLIVLAVPAISGRLAAGFAPAYLAVLLASAAGAALALARLVTSAVGPVAGYPGWVPWKSLMEP